jgi:hypothetical protein
MPYGQYTGLGAINREGLLKKNPLVGKAFGVGAQGESYRRQYQGIHDELRAGILQGKGGAGQGEDSLRGMAGRRFGAWSKVQQRDVEDARTKARGFQSEVYDAEDSWNSNVESIARLKGLSEWGDMLGMDHEERANVTDRMTVLSNKYGGGMKKGQPLFGDEGWSASDRASWLSDQKLLSDDVKRGGSAGVAARQANNALQDFQMISPALERALKDSREALAYQQNRLLGGEAELRARSSMYSSFFGGY